MCTRQQCIARLKEAAPYIQKHYGVKTMCLFGSMARGDNRENSDVDICVDMPPKLFSLINLKHYLETIVEASVDIVRLHKNINPFLLSQIKKDAVYVIRSYIAD